MQDIAQLPESARIDGKDSRLIIKNHKVLYETGMFYWLSRQIKHERWKYVEAQMHLQKVGFYPAVETCVDELESDSRILGWIITHIYDVMDSDMYADEREKLEESVMEFAASSAGWDITYTFIDNIRDCHSWTEFNDLLKIGSKFRTDMKARINRELKTWSKI